MTSFQRTPNLSACIVVLVVCFAFASHCARAIEIPTTAAQLKGLSEQIEKSPNEAGLYVSRGNIYAQMSEHAKAGKDFSKAGELGETRAFRKAGAEHFFARNFEASVAAFDAFAKHFPDQAPQLWERGISLYYVKRYADGRKQFEDHKAVNPHDVENAAWHFICAAKEMGVEKARKELIFIDTEKDARVPMKQVYQLFKGDGKPEDVITAAKGNGPAESKGQLCFAHLYLGLYFEATGDEKKARAHMEQAAVEYKQDHYMGLVAQVHWAVMKDVK